MKIQRLKEKRNVSKHFLGKTLGFTLVELIIVITILAILATIAFISFKSYSGNARDGNRVTTLASIQKGLELYQVKTGNFPQPDDIYGTGNFNGISLSYVGYIKENITKIIQMNKVPLDPKTGDFYVYGVSADNQKYQIATGLEELEANKIIPVAYANQPKAKVVGNYKYPLKLGTKLYSLPSLIFTGTGDLINNSTGFVMNNGKNLPYTLGGTNGGNIETIGEQLKTITGKDNLELKEIDTENITKEDLADEGKINEILDNLGITKDELENILFGNGGGGSRGGDIAGMCIGNLVLGNAKISNNTGLTENISYQNEDEEGECYYECREGFLGKTCNVNTNGEWSQLGGVISSVRAVSGRGELLVISEDEIYAMHEISGSGDLDLFKWDGTSWELISGSFLGKRANYFKMNLDKNNNIFVVYGDYNHIGAKKWDGSKWDSIGEDILLPYQNNGMYVELAKNDSNGDIFFYGHKNGGGAGVTSALFKYDGNIISVIYENLPFSSSSQWSGIPMIIYDNFPIVVGGRNIYKYNGVNWVIIGTDDKTIRSIGIFNGKLTYIYQGVSNKIEAKSLDNGIWNKLNFSSNISMGGYGYIYSNEDFLYLSSSTEVGIFDGKNYTDLNFTGIKAIVDMKVKNGHTYVLINPSYIEDNKDYERLKLYKY